MENNCVDNLFEGSNRFNDLESTIDLLGGRNTVTTLSSRKYTSQKLKGRLFEKPNILSLEQNVCHLSTYTSTSHIFDLVGLESWNIAFSRSLTSFGSRKWIVS